MWFFYVIDAVILTFLVLGALLIRDGVLQFLRARRLEHSGEGKTTSVRVTETRIQTGHRQPTFYYVSYHTDLPNSNGEMVAIDNEDTVGGRSYHKIKKNDLIDAFYLPANPKDTLQLASKYGEKGFWDKGITGIGVIIVSIIGFMITANVAQVAPTLQASVTVTPNASLLNAIRTAVNPHILTWQAVTDQQTHKVLPNELGVDPALKITEIDYGHCSTGGFYIYALGTLQPGQFENSYVSNAFFLLSNVTSGPDSTIICAPENWAVINRLVLDGGWSSGTVLILPPTTPTAAPTP